MPKRPKKSEKTGERPARADTRNRKGGGNRRQNPPTKVRQPISETSF